MTTILILINVIIIISSLLLIKTFKKITSDARDDAYYYYRKYQSEHQIRTETIAKMNELKNEVRIFMDSQNFVENDLVNVNHNGEVLEIPYKIVYAYVVLKKIIR